MEEVSVYNFFLQTSDIYFLFQRTETRHVRRKKAKHAVKGSRYRPVSNLNILFDSDNIYLVSDKCWYVIVVVFFF